MNGSWRLFQLQTMDTRLDEIKRGILKYKKQDGHLQKFKDSKAALEKLAATLDTNRRQQREASALEQDLREKRRRMHDKIYDGSMVNAKDIAGLENEIKALDERLEGLADIILVTLEQIENDSAALEQGREAIEKIERDARQEQLRINRMIVRLQEEGRALFTKRQAAASEVEAAQLTMYENLRKTKNGLAVAEIHNSSCSGCSIKLTQHKISEAASSQLTICPTCSRILYSK